MTEHQKRMEIHRIGALRTRPERKGLKGAGRPHARCEAQEDMGVSYPRIMQLWKSARGKLGVADVTELRLLHRLSEVD